jgi:hypothetical protein
MAIHTVVAWATTMPIPSSPPLSTGATTTSVHRKVFLDQREKKFIDADERYIQFSFLIHCNIGKIQKKEEEMTMLFWYIVFFEGKKKTKKQTKKKNQKSIICFYKREEGIIPHWRGVCLFSKQPYEKHMNLQLHLKQK